MLAILGFFPFMLQTAPFLSSTRAVKYDHPSTSRVGTTPAYQFTGQGAETIELSGVLFPEITGGEISLDLIRLMAETGKSWIFIEGTGKIIGLFVINEVSETKTEFFRDGKAKKIDFSLKMTRVDEFNLKMLGGLLF